MFFRIRFFMVNFKIIKVLSLSLFLSCLSVSQAHSGIYEWITNVEAKNGLYQWVSGFFRSKPETEVEGVVVKSRQNFKPFVSKKSTVKSLGTFRLMPGDTLKISFFEQISLTGKGQKGGGPHDPQLRSFYERKDLSGQYKVTEAGQLIIPVLGALNVEGKDLPQLKKEVEKLYNDYTKRKIEVNLKIVERPPIFVSGIVAQPGVYKYISGMTVKHAIALAAGFKRGETIRSLGAELNKEKTRLKLNTAKLERALVERSKVDALLSGRSRMKMPKGLVKLVGKEKAVMRIRKKQRIVTITHRLQSLKRKKLRNAIKFSNREISALAGQNRTIQRQFRAAKSHVVRIKSRYLPAYIQASRKLDLKLTRLENKMLSLEGQEAQNLASVAAVQLKKDQAAQELSTLGVDQNVVLTKELMLLDNSIIEYEMNIEGAKGAMTQYKLASVTGKGLPVMTGKKSFYSITRRKNKKQVEISAQSDTLLSPGDIVTVGLNN